MIPNYSKRKLNELLSQGLNFTVASARNGNSVRSLFNGIDLRLPVVGSNGAYISEFKTGAPLMINAIDSNVVKEIFSTIKILNSIPFVTSHNGMQDCLHFKDISNEGMLWYLNQRTGAGDRRLRRTTNVEEKLDERIICLNVINRKEDIEDLFSDVLTQFADHVEINYFENPYSPGWQWMTIYYRRATKDFAIRELINMVDVRVDELIVFEDNHNDISMFNIATKAVAVRYAPDEVKLHASQTIGTNQEDWVIDYIADDMKRMRC